MRLGEIRRRLRLQAALEGAVRGAALAALGLAVGVAIARGRGGAPPVRDLAALMFLGTAAGAAARGARRITLTRCARIADAALDGQDRLLSALCLDAAEPSPFARALRADAIRRVEVLVPGAAVPARRPAGLSALGLAGLALAAAALVPGASHAARIAPLAVAVEPRRPLPDGALDSEREAARDAVSEAARLGDERLAALAGELDRTLRRLADGKLNDGAALDLLRALEARTTEAARDARRDGLAAEAAARALEASGETRAAGSALAQTGAGTGDDARAREALGASAAAHPAETARALTAAAQNLAGAAESGGDAPGSESKEGPRRLEREAQNGGSAGSENGAPRAGDPETRHLEQLRRDLDDAAAACRSGDASCRSGAEDRAQDLARLGRQGAARDALQRLQRTAEQVRARIGRGELRQGDTNAMRSFGRAARGAEAPTGTGSDSDGDQTGGDDRAGESDAQGKSSEGGAGARARKPGSDEGQGNGNGNGAEAAAASAAFGTEGGDAPSREEAGTGNGIGHQPGGPPLGARAAESGPAAGSEADVPIADGAGPGRAEVIGTAAGHGFATRGYARMFGDYAAAVEDALGTTAVPEGKRYLVRRYFDLIRPRPDGRTSRSHP
jgi:hypothetical protein